MQQPDSTPAPQDPTPASGSLALQDPARTGGPPAPQLLQPQWRWWHVLLVLSLLGPILAPLFRSIGTQPFTGVATFIYWLGNLVCPLPDTAIVLFGQPMALCPLCYSALVAITAIAFSYPLPARLWTFWHRLDWLTRFGVLLALLVPWLALYSIFRHSQSDATAQLLMLAVGLLGGSGVALLAELLAGLVTLPKENPV